MRPLHPAIAAAAALVLFAQSARADIQAMATLSVNAITDDTGAYDYTITLQNTGDTDIGTFWYAWQPGADGSPDYNFMATYPSISGQPSGWYGYVTGGAFLYSSSGGYSYDGYGIEWYNYGGSPIAPGDSATFSFSSFDSPDVFAGDSPDHPGIPMQTSSVYIGNAEGDPGASFVVAPVASPAPVPEPASLALLACGLIPLLHRSRKNRTVPPH